MGERRSPAAGLLARLLAISLLFAAAARGQSAPAPETPPPPAGEAPPAADTAPPAADAALPAAPAPAEGEPPADLAAPPAGDTVEETPPLRVLKTGGINVETAALIMSGQQGGPVPVVALGVPFQGTGERALVPVMVEVKGSSLLTDQPGPLRFDVSIYVLGAKGDIQGTLGDTVELDVARMGPLLVRSGVKFVGEVALLPGEYTMRVLVRERGAGLMGLRSFPLTVPDFKTGAPYISPPLFPEPPDVWVVARASGLKRAAASRLDLVEAEGETFPTARPILAPGDEADLEIAVSGIDPAAELRAEIRKPGAEQVADLPVAVTGRRPTPIPGLEILTATIELGKDLEWGEREIRITAPTAAGAAGPLHSIAVLGVLGKGGEGRVWAELGPVTGKAAEMAATAVAEAPSRRRRQINERAVQASYRQALVRLGNGDEQGARTAVSEIEVPLLTGKNTLKFEEMSALEMKVAQSLVASQPESLVPVLMLYQLLYRDYLGRKQFLPAAHAGDMVFRLADLYAQRGGPEAKKLASTFLVALAQGHVSSRLTGLSERAFKRALAYDDANPIALLSLAVHAEWQSHYPQAVDFLERLVRSHPGHAEGRLRLALNLAREGKKGQAEKALDDLAADEKTPDWVASLAYQEIARGLIARQDWKSADRVLQAGVARVPGDEKLLIQRAFVLDSQRAPGEARGVLDGVKANADPKQRSARHRYGELPNDEIESAWNSLKANVTRRLPMLAAAMRSGS